MDGRDALLADWVEQPPASPVVQYLRDAEREAALALLDPVLAGDAADAFPPTVLDLGSEADLTRALLDAGARVVRADFSPAATERAREALGAGAVDSFATVEPEAPTLPFATDRFDAAVCLGPADWRFLDLSALAAAAARVVAPDGRVAVSAPTPRSPYETGNRHRLRYRSPAAFAAALRPWWRLDDRRYCYQFRPRTQWLVSLLPDRLQERAVAYARRRGELATDHDRPGDASYVVLGGRAPGYRAALDRALDCLFRADDGFWDPDRRRFRPRLDYELDGGTPTWTPTPAPDRRTRHRYGPFATVGVARWRAAVGDDRYDGRLRDALAGYRQLADDERLPSYATGPLTGAFALVAGVDGFDRERWLSAAAERFRTDRDRVEFDDAEDALPLHGWSYLYEALAATDAPAVGTTAPDVREAVRAGLQSLADRQSPTADWFAFDGPTAHRHQNQMYALWGLCRGIAVAGPGARGYLPNAERVLARTVERRLRPDGGLRWFDPGRRERLGAALREGVPDWELLFACHQSFFVSAVAAYRAAGGSRSFDTAVGRAMAWLAGANGLGRDLTAASGLGVPMRHLTTDDRLDAQGQQFKGVYEVGAYVMALTDLCRWQELGPRP